MHVVLTSWHEQENCTWCERPKECVTVDFGDGFIRHAPLCWKCLQKAVKVRYRQRQAAANRTLANPERIAKPTASSREPPAG